MSDIVIRAENLGKQFHIGALQKYDTLRDRLAGVFKRKTESGKRKTDEDVIWALKDVNFEIKQGEVVGVIGRNGAGKSTLLKILSKITEPTVGRVELHGRVGSLLEVGTGFHPELTGRENVFLNGAILGMRREEIRRRFDEIVAFSEVEKFIDTPVKHYSSGMYMRLAFAVAAHLDPEILLVDEVLAVGDTQFQKKCLGKMGKVAQEGRTVLFVSHNMQAIRQLCGKSIYFEGGYLTHNGATNKAISLYFNQNDDKKINMLYKKGNDINIKSISYSDVNNKAKDTYLADESININIEIENNTTLKQFTISMALLYSDGIPIFSETYDDYYAPVELNPGKYTVQFKMELKYLKYETYYLSVYLTDMANGRTLDHIDGIALPEITNPKADQYIESKRWGLVRIPIKWKEIERIR